MRQTAKSIIEKDLPESYRNIKVEIIAIEWHSILHQMGDLDK